MSETGGKGESSLVPEFKSPADNPHAHKTWSKRVPTFPKFSHANPTEKSGPKLARVEEHQLAKRTSLDDLKALSWKIATAPAFHRSVAGNPYSETAQAHLADRFPETTPADRARAVILAEPEGQYDRQYKMLPREEKQEALYEQIDRSADMTVRLSQHLQQYGQDFWQLTPEEIYTRLSEVAFDTADRQKIEEVYSQNQRRGFRLAISNFIEDLPPLKKYKEQFDQNPKETTQEIFGKTFDGEVKIESLPTGFVIYLDGKDFDKVAVKSHVGGMTVYGGITKELEGKIILLNKHKAGEENTAAEMEKTKQHELKHMLFNNFFEEGLPSNLHDLQDPLRIPELKRKQALAKAKDESIAYLADERFYASLDNVDLNNAQILDGVEKRLWKLSQFEPEIKRSIYDNYRNEITIAAEQIRTYQWIVRQLMHAADEGREGLTREKAEALLQITPIDQAYRLGKYFGVESGMIQSKEREEQQQLQAEFTTKLSTLVEEQKQDDKNVTAEAPQWEKAYEQIVRFTINHPNEAIPGLLHAITTTQNQMISVTSMDMLEEILTANKGTLRQPVLDDIRETLDRLIQQANGDEMRIIRLCAVRTKKFVDRQMVDFVHNPPEGITVGK
jgi:hypothetical protein